MADLTREYREEKQDSPNPITQIRGRAGLGLICATQELFGWLVRRKSKLLRRAHILTLWQGKIKFHMLFGMGRRPFEPPCRARMKGA